MDQLNLSYFPMKWDSIRESPGCDLTIAEGTATAPFSDQVATALTRKPCCCVATVPRPMATKANLNSWANSKDNFKNSRLKSPRTIDKPLMTSSISGGKVATYSSREAGTVATGPPAPMSVSSKTGYHNWQFVKQWPGKQTMVLRWELLPLSPPWGLGWFLNLAGHISEREIFISLLSQVLIIHVAVWFLQLSNWPAEKHYFVGLWIQYPLPFLLQGVLDKCL